MASTDQAELLPGSTTDFVLLEGSAVRSISIIAPFAFLLGIVPLCPLVRAQDTPEELSPEKAQAIAWSAQVTGRHYYLKAVRDSFLINDQIDVVECVVRYHPTTDEETGASTGLYRAKVLFRGASPAPQEEFRMTFDKFNTLKDLDMRLNAEFSPTPLEDAYEWPPEIKQAVRYRYIALGMDTRMVALALGGLAYQVDLEQLDDKRVRETWKLQVKGDTRKIFSTRTTYMDLVTSKSGQSNSDISTFITAIGSSTALAHSTGASTGTSTTTTTGFVQQSGFFVFSGLPPEFLNIVFTDGKVTARKTEFVK